MTTSIAEAQSPDLGVARLEVSTCPSARWLDEQALSRLLAIELSTSESEARPRIRVMVRDCGRPNEVDIRVDDRTRAVDLRDAPEGSRLRALSMVIADLHWGRDPEAGREATENLADQSDGGPGNPTEPEPPAERVPVPPSNERADGLSADPIATERSHLAADAPALPPGSHERASPPRAPQDASTPSSAPTRLPRVHRAFVLGQMDYASGSGELLWGLHAGVSIAPGRFQRLLLHGGLVYQSGASKDALGSVRLHHWVLALDAELLLRRPSGLGLSVGAFGALQPGLALAVGTSLDEGVEGGRGVGATVRVLTGVRLRHRLRPRFGFRADVGVGGYLFGLEALADGRNISSLSKFVLVLALGMEF